MKMLSGNEYMKSRSKNGAKQNIIVNLSESFPISSLVITREVLLWIVILSWFTLILWAFHSSEIVQGNTFSIFHDWEKFTVFLLAIVLFLLLKVSIALINKYSIKYYIVNGDRLEIIRGCLTKRRGSYPISQITEIYIHRNFWDFLFGLASIEIHTPSSFSGDFAFIHGIKLQVAEALQRYLIDLVQAKYSHTAETHEEQPVHGNFIWRPRRHNASQRNILREAPLVSAGVK